ncbi:Maf family protein [Telmatospirillum sp.]|uniref:Maf family protein n=1 Tax=Telmatospirillum sp. TaxID=2079197 RepID=UPI002848C952|nr:Maf family protein [Telmatospirillum sp.]MDR3439608.1 Maf family protein [Telmatospirillum sp.]
MTSSSRSLILASGSQTRLVLLTAAGLTVTAEPADLDESACKVTWRAAGRTAENVALGLAEAKAAQISLRHPEALVIGADQMLVCGEDWFDKPVDRNAAYRQLSALAGRTHFLMTAVAVLHDGEVLWSHGDRARMTMRPFSEAFLENYLNRTGEAVLSSVGAYQLEGLGVQLFEKIEGDHFTILGLPLLPLLDFLRRSEVLKQ